AHVQERRMAERAMEQERTERATEEEHGRRDGERAIDRRASDEKRVGEQEERQRENAGVRNEVIEAALLGSIELLRDRRSPAHERARDEPHARDDEGESESDDVGRKRVTDSIRHGGERDGDAGGREGGDVAA